MDVTTLAKDLAGFLTPLLPYLLKAGEKAGEEVGKQFGAGTWDRAKALWGKLHPKVEPKPAAQEAVQDAASTPADADAQAAFRLQLKKLLTEDESLAQEIMQLLDEGQPAGASASGERSVAVGRDVSGSTIVTGDQNVMQQSKRDGRVER